MGIHSLGYLHLGTPRLDEWLRFGRDVLGFMPVSGPDEASLYFRWDDHPHRLVLSPADESTILAVGYEVVDDRAGEAVIDVVRAAGLDVVIGTDAEARQRLVSGFARFIDPAGVPVEVFWAPVLDHVRPVTPLVSGFVTGEMGLGHVVLNVDDIAAETAFYRDVLGFHRRNTWHRGEMEMAFLGCNDRHHTLALGQGIPLPVGLLHFMVEVATIDDVGYAQDRCQDAGVAVTSSIGRHTNDHMISFYCRTPDGFNVELGWGGLRVPDPDSETTYQITKPSLWGHRPLR